MNRGEFDSIREKLYDLQMPVDAGMWDDIAGSLRRRKRTKLVYWASSVAAAIIVALFVFFPSSGEEEPLVAMAQKVEQVPATGNKEIVVKVESEERVGKEKPAEQIVRTGKVEKFVENEKTVVAEVVETVEEVEEVGEVEAAEAADKQVIMVKHNNLEQQENEENIFEKYIAQAEAKKERKYTVALSSGVMPGSSASVAGSIIRATSAGAGNISQSKVIEQISDTRYSLPLNLGVQFQFPLKHNMALGVGVNYTMLRSSYDCLINKKSFNIKQTLHYIGIPINVYGLVVDKNNFGFYVNAGGTLEKGIRAVYHLKSYDSSERNSSAIDGMQFSINGGLGVEYRLNNTLGLYFEPNIVYYFNSDIPRSIRTDQPLQVKAELGFRFKF